MKIAVSFLEIYEIAQIRLYAAKMHSYGYLFHRFKDAVGKAPPSLVTILTKLCQLYGLYNIVENSGAFLQYEYFNSLQVYFIDLTTLDGLDSPASIRSVQRNPKRCYTIDGCV